MPDPIGYGSTDRPFPEAFGWITEVGWGSVQAVKWGAAAALNNESRLAVPDSATGTMSMWLKFDDGSFFDILAFSDIGVSGFDSSNAFLTINAGGYTDFFPDPGPIETSLRLWMQARHDVTDPPRPGMFYLDDLRIADLEKWYHIYMEWDNNVGHCVLKINGVTVPAYEYPGDVYLTESHTGPPFTTLWSESDAGSLTMFSTYFRSDAAYSIADFWMDIDRVGVGVEKFVNLETGRPRLLGAFGEKPITPAPTEGDPDPEPIKPAFFFHRQGDDPLTFLENRGTGSSFALTGDNPTIDADSPKYTP